MPSWSFNSVELVFLQALLLIVVACALVPIFIRLSLGAVLGFLLTGVLVNVLFAGGFAKHPEELLHFSEFGVVLFLFVIGLELRPPTLWAMRRDIFAVGLLQVLACGAVLGGAGWALGLPAGTALVVGLGLALSSTALVMSQLDARAERDSAHGRQTFSILLFQDLAIVPLLLLVALLSPGADDTSFAQALLRVGMAVLAIGVLILAGRFLLDPLFKLLAKSRTQEIMTAAALGVVIAAAMLMDAVGMSYAMGAFIAGVLLADSAFRHEVEANIEPFRGLFLGLFFIAVGLSIDLSTVLNQWHIILLAAPLVMAVKAAIIYLVVRAFGNPHTCATRTGLGLAQLGEFGFVLFSAAAASNLLAADLASLLIATVAVSMALSPLFEKLTPLLVGKQRVSDVAEDFSDARGQLLIIGFGRFGQIVSQPLFACGYEVTILDADAQRVKDARGYGFHVHYGDGARRDILNAAGIGQFKGVLVCTDKAKTTNKIIDLVKSLNPNAAIFARSYDRLHSMELYQKDIDFSMRETFESALMLGRFALIGLGVSEQRADRHVAEIRAIDRHRLMDDVQGHFESGVARMHRRPNPSEQN